MKLISFVVPCYNSAEYMGHCVDTLLAGGSDVEIIIINDGSADRTGAIADGYSQRFPDSVRVIHQQNGGYGEGVNRGLKNAGGTYFKVVDSDDWVDEPALMELLAVIRGFAASLDAPDLFICNYVYEHAGSGAKKTVSFHRALPRKRLFTWAEMGTFGVSRFLLMHALVYRTDFLRNTAPPLPPHTFYVDNILAYQPLPAVKTIYYTDIPLYHYYMGRPGQTIDEQVLIRNIGQHVRVIRILIDTIDYSAIQQAQPRLGKYMRHGLAMMMLVASLILLVKDTEESLLLKAELWDCLKSKNAALFRGIRYRSLCVLAFLPGKAGQKISVSLYHTGNRMLALTAKAIHKSRALRAKLLRAQA
jgi:hypothetical protein